MSLVNYESLIAKLERECPFEPDGTEGRAQKKAKKYKRYGYHMALRDLKVLAHKETSEVLNDWYLLDVYGLKVKRVNDYHVKLHHEEYEGWFDWYHTTGTVIANRDSGASNIGKTKNVEKVAKIILNHI